VSPAASANPVMSAFVSRTWPVQRQHVPHCLHLNERLSKLLVIGTNGYLKVNELTSTPLNTTILLLSAKASQARYSKLIRGEF
jgi:hypothetical protein